MNHEYIAKQPEFIKLTQTRRKMAIILSLICFVILLGNLCLMSIFSDLGGRSIIPNSSVSVAIAYSIFVVVSGAAVCAFYVSWANRKLDGLISDLQKKIMDGDLQ